MLLAASSAIAQPTADWDLTLKEPLPDELSRGIYQIVVLSDRSEEPPFHESMKLADTLMEQFPAPQHRMRIAFMAAHIHTQRYPQQAQIIQKYAKIAFENNPDPFRAARLRIYQAQAAEWQNIGARGVELSNVRSEGTVPLFEGLATLIEHPMPEADGIYNRRDPLPEAFEASLDRPADIIDKIRFEHLTRLREYQYSEIVRWYTMSPFNTEELNERVDEHLGNHPIGQRIIDRVEQRIAKRIAKVAATNDIPGEVISDTPLSLTQQHDLSAAINQPTSDSNREVSSDYSRELLKHVGKNNEPIGPPLVWITCIVFAVFLALLLFLKRLKQRTSVIICDT